MRLVSFGVLDAAEVVCLAEQPQVLLLLTFPPHNIVVVLKAELQELLKGTTHVLVRGDPHRHPALYYDIEEVPVVAIVEDPLALVEELQLHLLETVVVALLVAHLPQVDEELVRF